jgi:hypothetical protein
LSPIVWFLAGFTPAAALGTFAWLRGRAASRQQANDAGDQLQHAQEQIDRAHDSSRGQQKLLQKAETELQRRNVALRISEARCRQLEAALDDLHQRKIDQQAEAQRRLCTSDDATTDALGAPELATTLGEELASIVSGIEGGTFRLIEISPLTPARTSAAEGLWLAVRRLRRLHDKVRAYVQKPERGEQLCTVESLLVGLRHELESSELGLQMSWHLPRILPKVAGTPEVLLEAVTFLSVALQQLERGALRLSIEAEPSLEIDSQPMVRMDLCLEWDEDPGATPSARPTSPAFRLARSAARNLLHSQGGSVMIEHEPGSLARALVLLRAASSRQPSAPSGTGVPGHVIQPTPATLPTVEVPRADHRRYSGVLLLERDPTVRAMLSDELKASGRSVFACADVAAARSLMQATPDRFEMLIVDQAARLATGDRLASVAQAMCPTLKFFVLAAGTENELPPEIASRVHRIPKPFGVHELRRALSTALQP